MDTPWSHIQLRDTAVNYTSQHEDFFSNRWDGLWPAPTGQNNPCPSFRAYLELMATPGTWGGALEILAICATHRAQIHVIQPTYRTVLDARQITRHPVKRYINLFLENNHYEYIPPQYVDTGYTLSPSHGSSSSQKENYSHLRGGTLTRSGKETSQEACSQDKHAPEKTGGSIVHRASQATIWLEAHPPSYQPNSGNGNCLFIAISQCINSFGTDIDHEILRHNLADHMSTRKPFLIDFWDRSFPSDQQGNIYPCHTFQDYLNTLRRTGTRAGDLELIALGDMLEWPILVIGSNLTPLVFSSPRKHTHTDQRGIVLWLHQGQYQRVYTHIPRWIWHT